MFYFTADPHFGHGNIIKYCKRPFSSAQEMDETIISNINAKVTKSDTLFVLGDFCFKSHNPQDYLNRINCKDVWSILGNHDACDHDVDAYRRSYKGFRGVENYMQIRPRLNNGQKQLIVLFHYPIQEWNGWHRGSWHLSGHTHSNNPWSHNNNNQYILDVGVDCHNYSPLSLDEVAAIMTKKDWKNPFDTWEKEGRLWKKDRRTEEEIAKDG
jgi:calcineurin-like phosphoesterase family protein